MRFGRNIHACYELYPEKLEKATQAGSSPLTWTYPLVEWILKKIVRNDDINRSFSKEITAESEKKANRGDRVQKRPWI